MSDLFSEDFLSAVLTGNKPGAAIVSSTLYKDSWDSIKTVVFSFANKFYRFAFNEDSWDDDGCLVIADDVVEVHPKQKTVTVYE